MVKQTEPLVHFLAEPTQLGQEISITGKWIPNKKSGFFRKSAESKEMIKEWEDIHAGAKQHEGILSTEVNHAIGQDAVLVHHVFKNADAIVDYFSTVAAEHVEALANLAQPDLHLIRGVELSETVIQALAEKNVEGTFGNYLFGYVKNDYQRLDPQSAIQVTAKWSCKEGESIDELIYWWQEVSTEAYDLEKGLIRFEVYEVIGENALIIHETFEDTQELQFHLSKGTAAKYKKDIDKIAYPEAYFFRGLVSWAIRTYSKLLNLPATYTTLGSNYTHPAGSMSEGFIDNHKNEIKMKNQEIAVVYKWTAKEGKAEELKSIYRDVEKQMQETEPDALQVDCFFDEDNNVLIVYDLFKDGAALGQHLGTTAAGHFPSLLQIAEPGPFLFCGEVPEELKQAAIGMGLDATFATRVFGFSR